MYSQYKLWFSLIKTTLFSALEELFKIAKIEFKVTVHYGL